MGQAYLTRYYASNASENARPDTVNILSLGESSTFGLWCDPKDSYPKQLERKLREHYQDDRIRVVYPPHIGQNTSQMSNRIKQHIELYHPKIVILMVGAINEWACSETHISRFVDLKSLSLKGRVKFAVFRVILGLDELRLFKVMRYIYLSGVARQDPRFASLTKNENYMKYNKLSIFGHAEYALWPPHGLTTRLMSNYWELLPSLWRYDVEIMIREARQNGSKVILMTYPAAATPVPEFIAMAEKYDLPLIRNDLSFKEFLKDKTMRQEYFFHDNWHPNAKGYSIIAQSVFDAIVSGNLLDR